MKKSLAGIYALALLLILQVGVFAQTTGSIAGTVTDLNDAVVSGATVTVTGEAGQNYTATTNSAGVYNIPAVASGFYTVTVTGSGFKTYVVQNVKVDVGTPATVNGKLEIGEIGEEVVVQTGAEVLQTQTATIGSTIQGRQIIETPIQSRDALDLVALMPGTNTVGTVRTSSINGLPKGSISITIDGVDVQDNYLRSSDGFFTYVRPRIDAMEEVTVSTANPGAESSGDGAVGIRFITRRGTNNYNGSLFWQHRDESLNANNWWNNRVGIQRQKIRLNQYGGRFGGPLPFFNFGEGGSLFQSGKDKIFFFVNYEEYRLPEASPTRTSTLLTPSAQNGVFTQANGTQVNLYNFALAQGLPNTPDPTIAGVLNLISNSASAATTTIPVTPNRRQIQFTNNGNQLRRFLALRFDVNVTKNHSVENVLNYQPFRSTADFLNGLDPTFPGIPNAGAQNSDRWSNSTALRSNFGQNVVNEFRVAHLWGESGFTLVGGTDIFDTLMGGYNLSISAPGITNPIVRNAAQIRTSPTWDFTDNLTWVKGNHSINVGGQYKVIMTKDTNTAQFRPVVAFGANTADTPLLNAFTTANLPGATQAEVNEMMALYAVLTGRVSGYTQNAYLGSNGQYVPSGPLYREVRQKTFGVYAQDTWRIKPNLTLNFGVRWQPQTGYEMLTENFAILENPDMVFDVSGPGNQFSPGTLTGVVPRVIGNRKGQAAFGTDWNNFAPSVGLVYSPDFSKGFMKGLFGSTGKSVFRAGYSRSFVREGTLLVNNTLGQNPGGSIAVSRSVALGNFTTGTLFSDPNNPNITPAPFNPTPTYPRTITAADAAIGFPDELRTGYVDSWSVGYQRQIDRDTVVEFRYVANRGRDMLNVVLQNEVNTIENGFANEFRLAQQNLLANIAAGRGNNFRYFGAGTGTSPLPIILSYFSAGGLDPNNSANYGSTFFQNATFLNQLSPANPAVQGMASTIESNFRGTGIANGRPVNFFNNCPTTIGYCFLVENNEISQYDAAVVELRRRLSNGVRFQASYVFGKAYTNAYAAASTLFYGLGAGDQSNASPVTLRNRDIDHSASQVDLRHAFKFDATWDLPFGRGRMFGGNSNWATNALIGGWSIVPTVRWQSGSPILLENIQLVGMTAKDLQKMIGVYKDTSYTPPGGAPYNGPTFLPADVIINTIKAYNTTMTGYNQTAGFGAPEGRFIAPAGYGNCQARTAGDCGFRKLVLYGPSFFKTDMALLKKIQIDEKRNIEFRATAFDLLNKTNWRLGGWTGNVVNMGLGGTLFGQWGAGTTYQDPFGSNDPGGRVIDLMLRINF